MIRSSRPILSVDVADHYEDLDGIYREIWGEHLHHGLWRTGRESPGEAVEQLVELVASEVGVSPGCSAVDIGCGYGATARQLADRYGAQVTGLTITAAQYRYAVAATPQDNPRYFLRDWLVNGLPDASFDAAYAIESTEHIEDKAGAFAEAFRVLRPGGRFVVCAWTAADVSRPWQNRHLLEPICREGRLPAMGPRRLPWSAGRGRVYGRGGGGHQPAGSGDVGHLCSAGCRQDFHRPAGAGLPA